MRFCGYPGFRVSAALRRNDGRIGQVGGKKLTIEFKDALLCKTFVIRRERSLREFSPINRLNYASRLQAVRLPKSSGIKKNMARSMPFSRNDPMDPMVPIDREAGFSEGGYQDR